MIVLLNGKKVTIPDTNYKGGGGEGKVYFLGGTAYKVYHDPASKMIPVGKILELTKIKSNNVLGPKEVICDPRTDKPIGFTMPYVSDSGFLCWLFNKGYKQKNGIDINIINKLVTQMTKTFNDIHNAGCIVADPNEMNFLISKDHSTIYFIDVDSYQTPSYRGTAVMKTVWDRNVPLGQFNKGTDYFGLAVITFQLYTGIHPYKCKHPSFKDSEIQKDLVLMDHNISVFSKDTSLPRNAMPLNSIPKNMLDWYSDVFVNKVRCLPPNPLKNAITIPVQQIVKTKSGTIEQKEMYSFDNDIVRYYNLNGKNYILTENNKLFEEKTMLFYNFPKSNTLIGIYGTNEFATIQKNMNTYEVRLSIAQKIGTIHSNLPLIIDNKSIYGTTGGYIYRYYINKVGYNHVILSEKMCTIFESTAKVFNKIITQDAIGTCWVIIPAGPKNMANIRINELDGHRIIDACLEYNDTTMFSIIISEHKGNYNKTYLQFKKDLTYDIVTNNCLSYESANLTLLQNGIGVSYSDDKLLLFRSINNIQSISDFPFDSTVKLASVGLKTLVIDKNKIFHISTK